jgi:L-seryl-tRNA(Ser) seleniumtransferase
MRVDKMTLAALEATLHSYETNAAEEIPVIAMLCAGEDFLRSKAEKLAFMLAESGITAEILPTEGRVGGGSVPNHSLPSYAVAFDGNVNALEEALRLGLRPIIGRIHDGKYLLDVLTLLESDFPVIVEALKEAML